MKIIDGIENIKEKFPYPVLTIGNFDGVHLGHQAIFNMLADVICDNSVFNLQGHLLSC